jgi:hypothetical protein
MKKQSKNKTTKPKPKSLKDSKYNEKRIPLFRIEIVQSDNAELLKQIKEDLIAKSGKPKQGIIEMHEFAKKHGYFNE